MRADGVEVIRDQRAPGASLALFGQPEPVTEHEVIDEELRAPGKEVGQRALPLLGVELIRLVDPNPRQLPPLPCQRVALADVFLLRIEQLDSRLQPFLARSGLVLRRRFSYSSWRRHQALPSSFRPLGARSSHWYMPHRPSSPRA